MSNTATTLDMRGQVMGVLCPKAAVVALADSVFREPIPVLVVAAELPAWLQRGSWIHVEGAIYFDAPPSIGGFTLEAQTIAAIPAEEWGGPEWVGAEEMRAPHVLTTQARVVTLWRYFDEPYYDEERVRGYAADVALPQGADGTRAVLHFHKGYTTGVGFEEEPPQIAVGDLLSVTCPLEWWPKPLYTPLPTNTPILEIWHSSEVTVLQKGAA